MMDEDQIFLEWAMQKEIDEQLEFEQDMNEYMDFIVQKEVEEQLERGEYFNFLYDQGYDLQFGPETEVSAQRSLKTEIVRPHFLGGINSSDVVKRRRTGSRVNRQQQVLSRKLHTCNRQEYGLK